MGQELLVVLTLLQQSLQRHRCMHGSSRVVTGLQKQMMHSSPSWPPLYMLWSSVTLPFSSNFWRSSFQLLLPAFLREYYVLSSLLRFLM